MTPPLLELIGIEKRFARRSDIFERIGQRLNILPAPKQVQALDGVSMAIRAKEFVGLVGESGCGKSTLGRIISGITSCTSGTILWKGREMEGLAKAERKRSSLHIQMVFQDPYASLNPRMRISKIVGEAPLVHGIVKPADYDNYVNLQLSRAGFDPAFKGRFPHQFSGGQRQRVGIARALAVEPEFLVCDEPVSALDVSIQAQIVNLFDELRNKYNLTYLFISHDLRLVEYLADRVVIMYLGRIVEQAPKRELYDRPNHPYTQGLLNQTPSLEPKKINFAPIQGEIPSPFNPPKGCHFHPRCPHRIARCESEVPKLREVAPNHLSACHLNDMR